MTETDRGRVNVGAILIVLGLAFLATVSTRGAGRN